MILTCPRCGQPFSDAKLTDRYKARYQKEGRPLCCDCALDTDAGPGGLPAGFFEGGPLEQRIRRRNHEK